MPSRNTCLSRLSGLWLCLLPNRLMNQSLRFLEGLAPLVSVHHLLSPSSWLPLAPPSPPDMNSSYIPTTLFLRSTELVEMGACLFFLLSFVPSFKCIPRLMTSLSTSRGACPIQYVSLMFGLFMLSESLCVFCVTRHLNMVQAQVPHHSLLFVLEMFWTISTRRFRMTSLSSDPHCSPAAFRLTS